MEKYRAHLLGVLGRKDFSKEEVADITRLLFPVGTGIDPSHPTLEIAASFNGGNEAVGLAIAMDLMVKATEQKNPDALAQAITMLSQPSLTADYQELVDQAVTKAKFERAKILIEASPFLRTYKLQMQDKTMDIPTIAKRISASLGIGAPSAATWVNFEIAKGYSPLQDRHAAGDYYAELADRNIKTSDAKDFAEQLLDTRLAKVPEKKLGLKTALQQDIAIEEAVRSPLAYQLEIHANGRTYMATRDLGDYDSDWELHFMRRHVFQVIEIDDAGKPIDKNYEQPTIFPELKRYAGIFGNKLTRENYVRAFTAWKISNPYDYKHATRTLLRKTFDTAIMTKEESDKNDPALASYDGTEARAKALIIGTGRKIVQIVPN